MSAKPFRSTSGSDASKSFTKSGTPPPFDYVFSLQAFLVSSKPLHEPFDVAYTASTGDKKPDTSGKAATPLANGAGCYNLTATSSCSFSQTISVDARQYWDVGVDATLHGPRENKYALSTANAVTQTHTIHSAFVGTLDLSPWAYKLPMTNWPYFQIGVPLSGASFHLPYAGIALPLPLTKKWVPLSVYGGVDFMRQTFPKTLKIGATTTSTAFMSDLKTDWPRKGAYGIELPVSQVIKKVKSSVGGK